MSAVAALLSLAACGQEPTPATNNQPTPDMASPVDMAPVNARRPFTAATLNVRLLFDAKCDSGRCGPNDFEALPTQAELDVRVAQLQDAVRVLDPDVLVLQEVETEALFKRVLGPYAARYPTQIFGETGGAGSVDVGIAIKGEHLETRTHRQTPLTTRDGQRTSFARELLEVHADMQGQRVIAFGAHLVSKRSDEGPRREAEAQAAARIMAATAQEHPGAIVVLGGDLNDEPSSQTLRHFYDAGIASASAGLPAATYYTSRYLGDDIIIDYVLYARRPWLELDQNLLRVFRDAGATGYAGSDHAAVRAHFWVK